MLMAPEAPSPPSWQMPLKIPILFFEPFPNLKPLSLFICLLYIPYLYTTILRNIIQTALLRPKICNIYEKLKKRPRPDQRPR